ncbi:MAG TPA: XrtA/PEP-CTERM system-associated ATPase [Sphingorhabdus sp.]|nr:XrtA/PEP-CTERM system-associated ATPase [Sphingorhabdus sp.]
MYDQFYGLSGRPFQLTPDPQFYFESATHRKALSYLGYGLAQGEGFIVITGEVGAGKSTLVSHLMASVDKARLTAATIVTSQLDGLDMVHMAAESFGIDTRGLDKAATLKSIENFLHAEARTGRRCLLVVDEAQNLSIDALEELRMLSNFQLGSQALLQIFLLGQPEFRDLVHGAPELEQLRQRIIATHHLEPMEANEVEPYIVHRLSRVGWTGRPHIAVDAFEVLFAETAGVPRKLNTLMNRVMLMGAVEQVDVVDGALVRAVIDDMAGKPFQYDAPMSARAPAAVQEPAIEEGPVVEPYAVLDPAPEPAVEAASPRVTLVEPHVEPASVANADLEALASRIGALEARVSEQDAALRRILAMMIDWMDREGSIEARFVQNSGGA